VSKHSDLQIIPFRIGELYHLKKTYKVATLLFLADMLPSTGVVYLVFCCMIHMAFSVISQVEQVECPSGSKSDTANFTYLCQCVDELPLQLQLPKNEVFCVSANARFEYTAFCNRNNQDIEFVQQRRHDLHLIEQADPHTFPIYTSSNTGQNIYIILECDKYEQKYFAMYMSNPGEEKILLAYQLIENPNAINTNDWVELCFWEGVREQLGEPKCDAQAESVFAPGCICLAETEYNFSGGCNACKTGMSKKRDGNNMCQCNQDPTCACTACGDGYEKLWGTCACKKKPSPVQIPCPPCETGFYASDNCDCLACPQSYDATDLTSKLNHNPPLVAGVCLQFV